MLTLVGSRPQKDVPVGRVDCREEAGGGRGGEDVIIFIECLRHLFFFLLPPPMPPHPSFIIIIVISSIPISVGGGNIPTMRHRNERIPASGSPGSPGSFAGLCFYFDVYLIVLIVWRFRWWLRDLDRIGGGFFGILQRFFWDSRRLARAFMGNRIGTGHESQRIPKNLKESPRILENPQES